MNSKSRASLHNAAMNLSSFTSAITSSSFTNQAGGGASDCFAAGCRALECKSKRGLRLFRPRRAKYLVLFVVVLPRTMPPEAVAGRSALPRVALLLGVLVVGLLLLGSLLPPTPKPVPQLQRASNTLSIAFACFLTAFPSSHRRGFDGAVQRHERPSLEDPYQVGARRSLCQQLVWHCL